MQLLHLNFLNTQKVSSVDKFRPKYIKELAFDLDRKYDQLHTPPVHISKIIDGERIERLETPLEYPIIASLNRNAQSIFVSSNEKLERDFGEWFREWKNFATAHLLGRFLLTKEVQVDFTSSLLTKHHNSNVVRAANQFAALILMPDGLLSKWPEFIYSKANTNPTVFASTYAVPIEVVELRQTLLSNKYRDYILSPEERNKYIMSYNETKSQYNASLD